MKSYNNVVLQPQKRKPLHYLFAVVGLVGSTHQVLIRPAIKVRVLAADESVPSVTDLTLALKHGLTEVAEVNALSRPVAVVGFFLAGVFLLTHLKNKQTNTQQQSNMVKSGSC